MRTQLFLNIVPIPLEHLKLGAIIPQPSQPTQDAHFPTFPNPPSSPSSHTAKQTSYTTAITKYGHTKLHLHLTVLGFHVNNNANVKDVLESTEGELQEMTDPDEWFTRICEEDEVAREKMEQWGGMTMTGGWLITGCRILNNARFTHTNNYSHGSGASADMATSDISTLAGGLSLPSGVGGSVGAGVDIEKGQRFTERFKSPGKQVYAIQLRRIKLSLLGTGDPKLSMKNTWKVLAAKRGGADETNQSIHADLQNTAQIPSLQKINDVIADMGGDSQNTDEYVLFDDGDDREDEEDEDDE